MAESTFDGARFMALLATRRLGRTLIARAEVESTNDEAWEALAAGAPDGTAVVADAQTRGRGRAGRSWHTAPGQGLALSVLLHPACDRRRMGALPLAAGLALARALDALGLGAELKWPNDLLLGGRKVAGLLAESRRTAEGADAAVLGAGVNVRQRAGDFPPGLDRAATSIALAGGDATREEVAAGYLNALEPLVGSLQEGDQAEVLAAWRARASFWGRRIRVRGAGAELEGIARDLDAAGALILERPDGARFAVLAGDVEESLDGERR